MENKKTIFSFFVFRSHAFCNTLFAPFDEDQTPVITDARKLWMSGDFMTKILDYRFVSNRA